MKSRHGLARHGRRRISRSRRIHLLAAFDRSGLPAAAFARQQGIGYSTFCGWRHRQAKAKPSAAFVEVELPAPAAAGELVIEVGAHARLRISSAEQVELAACFLRRFSALVSC